MSTKCFYCTSNGVSNGGQLPAQLSNKALPVLGNRGTFRAFISGEQRSKNEGNRGTKAILGNREHMKSRL